MTEPLIIRASSLDRAPDCMRRFAARLLRKEIKAAGWAVREDGRGVGAAIGTAVHFGASTAMAEKAKSGTLPPPNVATDAAIETLHQQLSWGVEYDKTLTRSQPVAEAQTLRQALSYHYYVAPYREPLHVEQRFEAAIAWTRQPMVLSGQPDMVCREPDDVNDVKAGSRRSGHNAQVGAYSLLAQSMNITVNGGKIDWVPRVPLKKPQPRPVERRLDIALSENMAVDTLRDIDRSVTVWREGDPERGLQPGDPAAFPANPASMLCGARYCPAHSCSRQNSFCNEWRKDEE
jgi:hypothetical protein